MSFNKDKIHELYPGAEDMMQAAMLIWTLPAGKENMMSEVCENGQYFAEEKLDGAWYQFTKGTGGEKYLFGRTISKVTGLMTEKGGNVPHILSAFDCIPNGTVLIGEIYYPGCTAKDTVTIMGCLPLEAIKRQEQTTGRGPIHYYVHDIIFYDGVNLMGTGAWDRYRILKAIWEKHGLREFDYLRLAEVVERDIEDEVSRILKSGGEGMVLKKRDAIYYPGKRPAWTAIKFKQMDDIDLVCTRTIPATREYTGKDIDTWQYWEEGSPMFYDCFEEDHCFGGWNWKLIQGNYSGQYKVQQITNPRLTGSKFMTGNEKAYIPVTKPYFYGWHTAIGIGAYDDEGNLIELGTVSSGLTDGDRALMGQDPSAFVGKVVSLHCMLIDRKEKTLRHPVFKSWREDKNPTDCEISEVFK